jgi:small-conductance mechanosensitive channel
MTLEDLARKAYALFTQKLFTLGQTEISLTSVVKFLLLLGIFTFLARFISRKWVTKILQKMNIDQGTRYTIRRVTEYSLIIIGAIIAFENIGINLSGLAVIFGLLSVGIGFGLQNVANNFISGLILLFERPISVGDRVLVGDTEGDVDEINIRSTTIRSLENIAIIVPNSEFISSKVVNLSHGDLKIRINIDVGVSYDSSLDDVLAALKEVAVENNEILRQPEPEVLFMEFGDSSWNMQLRCWIRNPKRHYHVKSDLNCAIVRKFRERNIEIPFPQRDLHVRSATTVPFAVEQNK